MAGTTTELPFLDELTKAVGTGGTAGAVLGTIGATIIAALSGGSLLSLLMIPVIALAGAAFGDYKTKDGFLFGEEGIIKTFKRKSDPKTIPEGYIASNPFASTFAGRSETIARTGEVHMSGYKGPDEVLMGYKEFRALDKHVELDTKGDPRLEALREKARGYKKRFVDKDSPDYIADTKKREKTIANLIVHDIGETYGPYSDLTLDVGYNSAEFWSVVDPKHLILGQKTVKLKDIEKGSLVCRHYAPIASILMDDAGVPNDLIESQVGDIQNKNGAIALMNNRPWLSGHAYMMTTEGNAVVEATLAGSEHEKEAYKPIVNGVTAESIVMKGKSAVPQTLPKHANFIYGGHDGKGNPVPDGFIASFKEMLNPMDSRKASELAMQKSIDAFNAQNKFIKDTGKKVIEGISDIADTVKEKAKDALGGFSFLVPGGVAQAEQPGAAPTTYALQEEKPTLTASK